MNPAVGGRKSLSGQPHAEAASLMVRLENMETEDGELSLRIVALDVIDIQHQAGAGLAGKGFGVQPPAPRISLPVDSPGRIAGLVGR